MSINELLIEKAKTRVINWSTESKKIRFCKTCQQYKSIRNFRKRYDREGVHPKCRGCFNKWRRERRNNREFRGRHAEETRRINATEEGKKKLKIRNHRAYLKRKMKSIIKFKYVLSNRNNY